MNMKYFLTLLIGCFSVQLACQSSSTQVTSNVQQASPQRANMESSPMTQVTEQPEIPAANPTSNPGGKGSAESHYLTFSGIKDVLITDGQGNNNGPVSTAYKKLVPGVTELISGPESIQIWTPTDNTYTMRFTGTGNPIAIEDIRGVNNEIKNAAYIVRYADLLIPSGRVAELKIAGAHIDSLKQDVDGDGTPETVIPPTRTITDPKNADMQPPTISVKWGPATKDRNVTVVATDRESGVKKIYYRAGNEGNFQTTDSSSVTFTVHGGPAWSIQVVTEDNAGNRSDVRTYTTP